MNFSREQRIAESEEAKKVAKENKLESVKLPNNILRSNDVCIYFDEKAGISIMEEIQKFKNILSEPYNVKYGEFIYDFFTGETIPYQLFAELSREHDLSGLGYYFGIEKFNVKQDLEALGRWFKASDFKIKIPSITIVEDGKIFPL